MASRWPTPTFKNTIGIDRRTSNSSPPVQRRPLPSVSAGRWLRLVRRCRHGMAQVRAVGSQLGSHLAMIQVARRVMDGRRGRRPGQNHPAQRPRTTPVPGEHPRHVPLRIAKRLQSMVEVVAEMWPSWGGWAEGGLADLQGTLLVGAGAGHIAEVDQQDAEPAMPSSDLGVVGTRSRSCRCPAAAMAVAVRQRRPRDVSRGLAAGPPGWPDSGMVLLFPQGTTVRNSAEGRRGLRARGRGDREGSWFSQGLTAPTGSAGPGRLPPGWPCLHPRC
jgi:hypothetical protein